MRTSLSNILVRPLEAHEVQAQPYDLTLFTIGYESRARFAAKELRPRSLLNAAIGFKENRVLRYYQNLRWFSTQGFLVEERDDDGFGPTVALLLERAAVNDARKRVLVDVSSLSRFRVAMLISVFERVASRMAVDVDFVYSPAVFSPPQEEDVPIVSAGPVTPSFAGWNADPDSGAVAIVGVGYEPRRAAGIIELLEPSDVWAFVPDGFDSRFGRAVQVANADFWPLVRPERVVHYRLDDPHRTFLTLESLARRVVHHGMPTLIPFGPKVFNLCCVLAAVAVRPGAAVWRISSGSYHTPQDRKPSGRVIAIRASFESTDGDASVTK